MKSSTVQLRRYVSRGPGVSWEPGVPHLGRGKAMAQLESMSRWLSTHRKRNTLWGSLPCRWMQGLQQVVRMAIVPLSGTEHLGVGRAVCFESCQHAGKG